MKHAILTLTVLLTACGAGGSPEPAARTQAPAIVQPKSVIIDAEGDSLIWGLIYKNGVYQQTSPTPPQLLQADLTASLGAGYSIEVDNRAMPGATAEDSLYAVLPYYGAQFSQRIMTTPGKIVLADYAVNDSRQRSTDEYAVDLSLWIADVRAAGKIPVLEEPNPTCDPTAPNVSAYVTVLRNVAQANQVTLIAQYDYIASLPNWQSMLTDCLHPNDALYAVKAQREAAVLGPMVQALP